MPRAAGGEATRVQSKRNPGPSFRVKKRGKKVKKRVRMTTVMLI